MRPKTHQPFGRQSGSASLVVGLILLLGAGILTFSATRTGVMEQRIATNELRAKEARQVAQAGLEYAVAWLSKNSWQKGVAEPRPPAVATLSGDTYQTHLAFDKTPDGICVQAHSSAASEPGVYANLWECVHQSGLFAATRDTSMPAPLVVAGCMSPPDQRAGLFVSPNSAGSIMTGRTADADCLPIGSLAVSRWRDENANRVMEPDEEGHSSAFERVAFTGCPASHCAWKQVFAMGLEDAKKAATRAHHVYSDDIPCGATRAPGIYLIRNAGPIGSLDVTGPCREEEQEEDVGAGTIGTPSRPVLLIVPSDTGCPAFTEDIRIHGIVYYETTTGCANRGWGGAQVQGSVIWEGNVEAPAASSRFIETDYGSGGELNDAFQVILDAARVPGSWRDWD